MELTLAQRVHQEYVRRHADAKRFPYSLTFEDNNDEDGKPIIKEGFVYARSKVEASKFVDVISRNYSNSLSNNGTDNWYGAKMDYSASKKQRYAQVFGTAIGVRNLTTNIKKGFNLGGLTPFSLFKLVNLNIKSSLSNYFANKEGSQELDEKKKISAFYLFLICLLASLLSFFGLIAIILFSSSIFSFYSYVLLVVCVLGTSIVSALWSLLWPKKSDDLNE